MSVYWWYKRLNFPFKISSFLFFLYPISTVFLTIWYRFPIQSVSLQLHSIPDRWTFFFFSLVPIPALFCCFGYLLIRPLGVFKHTSVSFGIPLRISIKRCAQWLSPTGEKKALSYVYPSIPLVFLLFPFWSWKKKEKNTTHILKKDK